MTDPNEEFHRRYQEVPYGRESVTLLEEWIRYVDTTNEQGMSYGLRRQYIQECINEGMPEKAIVAFSWCLTQFDKNEELDEWHSLIWQYKTILELIPIFSTVSRDQITQMQEDMARRLAESGHNERTAHYYRSWNLMRMGDYEKAMEYQVIYLGMERTSISDCIACERDRQIELLSRMQRNDEALAAASPVLTGEMVCSEVPEFTNGHLVKALLQKGDVEAARERQLAGYEAVRGEEKYLGTIGDLMLAVIRTDRFDEGIQQVNRHLQWAVAAHADELQMRFYAPVGLLLEKLATVRPQSVGVRIPQELSCWSRDGKYDPAALGLWFRNEAQQIADRFNQRNGNKMWTQTLTGYRELVGLTG